MARPSGSVSGERPTAAAGRDRQGRGALRDRGGHADLAVPDEILQLGRAPLRADRHYGDPERVQRQEVKQKLGPVKEQQPCAMPVAVAGGRVGVLQPGHLVGGLRVRPGARLDAQRRGHLR